MGSPKEGRLADCEWKKGSRMKQGYWREQSEVAIRAGYTAIKECEPKLSNEQIIKKISRDWYPFGQREMHPYKMWLKCIAEFRAELGLPGKPKPEDPNQPALWDAKKEGGIE